MDFLQMGFVKARLNDAHCPWNLTSATIRDGAPFDNILHLLGLRGTPLHIIRRSNYRPEIQPLFREFTFPIDGDSFPELEWVLESGRSTLIFAKTISLGTRIQVSSSRTPAYPYGALVPGPPNFGRLGPKGPIPFTEFRASGADMYHFDH
jgi:hypothetical protein